jgi:hypothetical protein
MPSLPVKLLLGLFRHLIVLFFKFMAYFVLDTNFLLIRFLFYKLQLFGEYRHRQLLS